MMGNYQTEYPPQSSSNEVVYGVLPVDFLLEVVLTQGVEWFKNDPKAPSLVYGHLYKPWLAKYGPAKAVEIRDYVRKYGVKVAQSFALIDAQMPSFSIQLLDGGESTDRSGLVDHQSMVDAVDFEQNVIGRSEVGFISMTDNVHIGIHNINTPDLTKYLYYLVVYILSSSKDLMEKYGLMLGTFRATDISRLNEFLPENMYSRFINFSVYTIASFDKGSVLIVDSIQGINVATDPTDLSDTDLELEFGMTLSDISQGAK